MPKLIVYNVVVDKYVRISLPMLYFHQFSAAKVCSF